MGRLSIAIFVFVAIWIVPIAIAVAVQRRKKTREAGSRPPGDPATAATAARHACIAGTYMPVVATSGVPPEVGDGLRVFEGVRCSACDAQLVCACGATPRQGAVLSSGQARSELLLGCCRSPDWRSLPEAAPSTAEDDDAPAFASYGRDGTRPN